MQEKVHMCVCQGERADLDELWQEAGGFSTAMWGKHPPVWSWYNEPFVVFRLFFRGGGCVNSC